MSLPIAIIVRSAGAKELAAAIGWTADNLHVPESTITDTVAVAYVVRHYQQGELSGWNDFVKTVEG